MKTIGSSVFRLIVCSIEIIALATCAPNQARTAPAAYQDPGRTHTLRAFAIDHTSQTEEVCPPPTVVEIREADPEADKQHHDEMRDDFMRAVQQPNTTVLLGPDVLLDFSDAEFPPEDVAMMRVRRCVTILSVNAFEPDPTEPTPTTRLDEAGISGEPQSARTGHSLGPLLNFGPHEGKKTFFLIRCNAGDVEPSDHIRFSGFRIHGPSFGQQEVDNFGIKIYRCLDIEISNMEIAGWGGAAVQVEDEGKEDGQPADGPGQEPSQNNAGERIGPTGQIRIFGNYFHHNQNPAEIVWKQACLWFLCVPYPTYDSHAMGYGVDIHHGAWAQIYGNVFDSNRHSIAAAGDTGGYEAFRNLVLKGGGIHFGSLVHTHQFDIHGLGGSDHKGGQAGAKFLFATNSFQYDADNAIFIRGTPIDRIDIDDNIFAHPGLEDEDWFDDAINVFYPKDIGVKIIIGPDNVKDYDSYGNYGVCDFDSDGIDDLFLATGKTWWYSSYGEFQWTYLSARTERLDQLRLGYFDDDLLCDVLTESGTEWVITSGGNGEWHSIGQFDTPLSEVAFGQFDPEVPDPTPGVTRHTTHAFRRTQEGQWEVTQLSDPEPDWHPVGSSSFPMSDLRFGDFTGDGVTDVLAVENGRWAISESAREPWRELNPHLSDDVRSLYIADLNNNNIDDLIKLERPTTGGPVGNAEETYTWWVSYDGNSPWRELKKHTISRFSSAWVPVFAFAGRFGTAPGAGVLLIDHNRIGHFYSEAEIPADASPDWTSLFQY